MIAEHSLKLAHRKCINFYINFDCATDMASCGASTSGRVLQTKNIAVLMPQSHRCDGLTVSLSRFGRNVVQQSY